MKVDFLICGRTAFDVLQHHVKNFGVDAINTVVCYADKAVQNDPYDEVTDYCNQHNILLRSREDYIATANIYRIAIGWQFMLEADGYTIVLHESLLPKYRGFSPLINSLINGERELGITAFIATKDFGAGPVIAQEKVMIDYPLTILQAMEKLTPLYTSVITIIFNRLKKGDKLKTSEQDHYLATYSLWRDEHDYKIDWKKSSGQIKRLIDALGFPYNGAGCLLNGMQINVKQAYVFGDVVIENRHIGKVIFIEDGCPVVVCKKGLIKITEAYFTETRQPITPFTKHTSRFA